MSGPFKLKSGNKSPLEFKMMGSSPVKQDEKKVQTKFDVGGTEVEFFDKKGDPIPPAGSMISGDIQKIYTDRSKEGLTSSDTAYYNIPTGDISYYDPETKTKSELYKGYSQKSPEAERGILTTQPRWPVKDEPYLGTKK
jgi:hypothetical protein|tara:strand:+ start:44 stop:460 length:417 start_codon:yes stop_codon:yes gene_type:complete